MTPRSAERYNKRLAAIFDRYEQAQKRYAEYLLAKGVPAGEVEKLKQNSGLHGNPLAEKYFEMGGTI